ncbi:MAG: leader peptidase (prepilin peptidase) / N-methyltransferase [Carnobacterium sp.]|nr:leader peptidase (prepilin peptidase) / N-methyltransferase [Carnobacterium sp.]
MKLLTSVFILLIWLTGCCLGSFLMVVGLRVPIHQSIVLPRSYCPNCHQTLHFFELLPVVSYLFQKGRCRNCHQPISILHLLTESLMGFMFLFIFYTYYLNPIEGLFLIGLASFSLVFTISDIYYQLLPNYLMSLFLLWVIAGQFFLHSQQFYTYLLCGLGFFIFFYLLYQFYPIGGGDVKLLGIIGLLLGYPLTLTAIMIACFSALLIHLPLVLSKKITSKHHIPFAPFIFFGTFSAYFLQEILSDWWLVLS